MEELHEQLPLNIKDSQVVIVSENFVGLDKTKQFQVRPKIVNQALHWLINNNHLYKDVQVIQRNDDEYHLKHILIAPKCDMEKRNSQKKLTVIAKNNPIPSLKNSFIMYNIFSDSAVIYFYVL